MNEIRKHMMSTKDTLLAYSEWLDGQGLVVGDSVAGHADARRPQPGDDKRSHDELAAEFIEQWEAREDAASLAGSPKETR